MQLRKEKAFRITLLIINGMFFSNLDNLGGQFSSIKSILRFFIFFRSVNFLVL